MIKRYNIINSEQRSTARRSLDVKALYACLERYMLADTQAPRLVADIVSLDAYKDWLDGLLKASKVTIEAVRENKDYIYIKYDGAKSKMIYKPQNKAQRDMFLVGHYILKKSLKYNT